MVVIINIRSVIFLVQVVLITILLERKLFEDIGDIVDVVPLLSTHVSTTIRCRLRVGNDITDPVQGKWKHLTVPDGKKIYKVRFAACQAFDKRLFVDIVVFKVIRSSDVPYTGRIEFCVIREYVANLSKT